MSEWYRKIPVKRSKAARSLEARKRVKTEELRTRKPVTIRNEKFVFYRTYSSSVYTAGYRTKVCSRYHIAKFFEVPVKTVHRWDAAGVLPEPFMLMEKKNGSPYPVYLSAQFRCLVMVMKDLVAEGYVSIPWHLLGDHIDMLHEGYAIAARNHAKRMQGDDMLMEKPGKFGVIFDD
jgi:hypothetical protein